MRLTRTEAEDDLRFWLRQDMEHHLFYTLGLRDAALRDQAKRILEAYEQALARDDLRAGLERILPYSQAFKTHVLDVMATGRRVGSLYPLFFEHTRMELDVMLARISQRGITAAEELCAGNRIDAEHAAFAAHLLDPTEVDAQVVADGAARVAGELARACTRTMLPSLLELSRRSAKALDAFVVDDLPKRRSVIHPTLARHVEREGKRFLGRIDAIESTQGGSAGG